MTRKKIGASPSFYGEPAAKPNYTTPEQTYLRQKKPRPCGYGCGVNIYRDKLTGKWMEESGELHSLQRCTDFLKKKNRTPTV